MHSKNRWVIFARQFQRLQFLIPKSHWKKVIAIFLIFSIVFLGLQWLREGLYGVDGFYHIKRAYLLRTERYLGDMSWMQFTVIKDRSLDIAFLFWVLLIPFTLGNLIWGAKLAVAFFGGIFFALFFVLLLRFKIKHCFWWLLLLLFASPSFIFMLNLARPHILAVSLVLLTLLFVIKHRYLPLFLLGLFYTLAYEVFFVYLVIVFSFVIGEIIFLKKFNLKLALASIGGILSGLLLHPYPYDYLWFVFNTLFRIPYYRFSGRLVLLGSGLHGAPAHTFLASIPFFLMFSFILIIFLPQRKKFLILPRGKKIILFSLSLLFVFFLASTFVSSMLIYYLIPLGILLFALVFQDFFSYQDFKPLIKLLKKDIIFKVALVFLILIWIFDFGLMVIKAVKSSTYFFHYQAGAEWLSQNTPARSIVFQSNWDSFPALFFYNHHNYYLVGLDPSVMYQYDPNLFWRWHNLVNCGLITTNSKICQTLIAENQDWDKFKDITSSQEIYDFIKNDFHSQYVFADKQYKQFIGRLEDNKELFKEQYSDNFVKIYRLK